MKPKNLYEEDSLTKKGEKISSEFYAALSRIFEEYASYGYSLRELGHIAHNEITAIEAVASAKAKVTR